jgi:hypothetical protein
MHHEVFAQHRQITRRSGLFQVVGAALKEIFVCEYRQACRAILGIALRNIGWLEGLTQQTFGWAGLFNLSNHSRCAAGHFGA